MKSLTLNLKKKLLIIDYETEEKFDQAWHSYLIPGIAIFHTDGSQVKPLFNGLELTEKHVEDLVFRSKIGNYKDYNYKEGTLGNGLLDALAQMKFKTAIESFISAIEKEGFYWLENPNGDELDKTNVFTDAFTKENTRRKWIEAEARTLRFPIIFEILNYGY